MFELAVQGSFSAAHRVKGYKGDCADIHGHSYRIEIRLKVTKLDKIGLSLDFHKIKNILDEILKKLDHKNLNNIAYFKNRNATAEWVAVYIHNEMKKRIGYTHSVTVWEGLQNSVTYSE